MSLTTESIIPISKIKPYIRCPSLGPCANPNLQRFAIPQDGTVAMNGAALWTFHERCNICGWEREIENVKLGA